MPSRKRLRIESPELEETVEICPMEAVQEMNDEEKTEFIGQLQLSVQELQESFNAVRKELADRPHRTRAAKVEKTTDSHYDIDLQGRKFAVYYAPWLPSIAKLKKEVDGIKVPNGKLLVVVHNIGDRDASKAAIILCFDHDALQIH